MSTKTKTRLRPGPIATFKRHDGDELRVTLDVYAGHPYVSLQAWYFDPQKGQLVPRKFQGSIRLKEIDRLINVLQKIAADPHVMTRSHRTPEMNAHVPTGIKPSEIVDRSLTPPWDEDDDWPSTPSSPPKCLE